jgi:hypothetical protein
VDEGLADGSGAGFSLWVFVLARTKFHRLKPGSLKSAQPKLKEKRAGDWVLLIGGNFAESQRSVQLMCFLHGRSVSSTIDL